MKKTETKISCVRKINDPALSLVKVKRHSVSTAPKSDASKANFNLPSGSHTTTVFSLPVAIPEEGLKELNCSPKIKTNPDYYKPSKKKITQAVKNKKKGNDGAESTTDGTSEYIYKLTSDIQAIEDKLSKVEGVLSKKIDNVPTLPKAQANSVSFKNDAQMNQKVYNASDYVDDVNKVTGHLSFYDRNSYSLELNNRIIKPLKSSEPLPQYPIDFDPKAAVSAIRSELEQWRKENRQTYPTLTSVSVLKNEASSCELVTSISEENTVSRDVAEKDIPSSSEDSRSKYQEPLDDGKKIVEQRATDFPLDLYLNFQKIKKNRKPMFEKELAEPELEPQPFRKTEKLIKQINDLATEAEEKVKACIYDRTVRPLPIFSPPSLDESDSGYTEHLVEAKFNEVTFQKLKGTEWKLQQGIRKDQLSQSRKSYINKPNNNTVKYGRDTYRSTAETMSMSLIPPKQINQKKFNPKLDSSKLNPHYIPKSSSMINPENRNFREELSETSYPKTSCHYCSCAKGTGIRNHLKHLNDTSKKDRCQHKDTKLFSDGNGEQINATYKGKQYNDASVNTEPLLVRRNTNLVNMVSSKEEKSYKMNDYAKKLCQIQELPLVVIRPNFTKQVGPVIDIKTTTPSSPKNNVAVVECIHGGTSVGAKENTLVNVVHESVIDSASQTVSPPAVHFKNSIDLKLLKVTKDLLGKLNFKDGANVERLKRSLNSLVMLLNQISPIHVANLRLSNLDAGSASESIDTFFSNIDLVTEIIENEIKKPTGRYCDYPECLIKAVDLLCGNIRSVFVIEDVRKRSSKPFSTNGPDEEKKKVKKASVSRVQKRLSKTAFVSQKPSSVTSSIETHETERSMVPNSQENIPGNLYIPYRLLIPGGKHKAMEEAKNSRDIELRFKRLEKVLEINENLKKAVPSKESIQADYSSQTEHSLVDEDKSISNKDAHALNETFVIRSASDDEGSETIQEKSETKVNKGEQDYEDDWEDVESSKSYDGSLAMTDINVVAQVHSSGGQSSLAHSSPKKQYLSNQSHQELSVSSKGSRIGMLPSVSDSLTRASRKPLKKNGTKSTKRQTGQNQLTKNINGELKDVETQYYVGKRDTATMYCEDINGCQKPKVEILEPITIPSETGSFTVLRMTNASNNSLLEVRFPEQTEKLHSSLTVQKTHNREEVKLLYNMDKEDKIISLEDGNGMGLKSVPPQKEVEKLESFHENTSKNIEKALTKCEKNINDKSPLEKKEDINDFQNITTNFIQFLESKVTEMVNKFKTSEVTCEKLLDQKLLDRAEHTASANNIHISSSKTSLKHEVFYKSASSLISTQSNEDYGNWLSRRCTPDNQEITPFENLTSPPLGLQLRDSSELITSEPQNIDPKTNKEKTRGSSLFTIPSNLERENQNRANLVSDKFSEDLVSDKINENMKLVLKEKEINELPIIGGLQNRLLPLPEDVNYNNSSSSSKDEMEKVYFSSASQLKVTAKIHGTVNNFEQKNTIQQIVETSSFKSNGTATPLETDISQTKSESFEEALLALVSVEQSFNNTDSIEESTVIVAKTPTILSKSEDDLDSQRTSVSNFANIMSAPESEIATKYQFQDKTLLSPKDPDSSVPSESKIFIQALKSKNTPETMQKEKDFSRLLPIPEQIEKDQSGIKFSDIKSQAVSSTSVHSFFVSGPSHVDRSLKSSDSQFRKTDKSPILIQEHDSSNTTSEIPSTASSIGSVENLVFDNPLHTPNLSKSDTVDSVSSKYETQLLLSAQNDKIAEKKQLNNFSQTSLPQEETIKAIPLTTEDISETSDDCIKLNYFNPEEMSDGEVGYVYTSNSYSSGEIKPYTEQNEDDILSEPPTFREIPEDLDLGKSLACGEPNLMKSISEKKAILKSSTLTETGTSGMSSLHKKTMEIGPIKSEKSQENYSVVDLLNSSNDSTSTGELKKLFNKEDKIDEGKLIDIHVHCSTRFSSESSGCAESVEDRESREDI